ncbi:GNAT family N-acetyltransferase [Pseudobacillus wudalianchiensis]
MFLPYIQNGAYYLIEEENQRLKGWLLLGIDGDFMAGNVIGQLLQIYVFPQYRKMGIGRKLMQEAIRQLQSQGMKKIHLNVFAGNPAKNMYKEFGFKKISTIMELNTEEKDRR